MGEYCRLDLCSGTPLSTVKWLPPSTPASTGTEQLLAPGECDLHHHCEWVCTEWEQGASVIPGSLLQAGGGRRRN